MIKTISTIIIITLPPITNSPNETFYFDGDYTECAKEYLEKNQSEKPYDINNVLYDAIAKELEKEESGQDEAR
jgi:hypothetical protein